MIRPDYTARRAFQTPVNAPKPDTEAHKVACISSYIADASRLAKFFAGMQKASTRMQGYHDTAEMLEAAARRLRELKPDQDRPKTSGTAPDVRPDALPVPLHLAWKTWEAETFEEVDQ